VNDKFLTHEFVEMQVEQRRAHRGIERVGNTTPLGTGISGSGADGL
jgi:hypothetical protein